jgi:hypothetical protein
LELLHAWQANSLQLLCSAAAFVQWCSCLQVQIGQNLRVLQEQHSCVLLLQLVGLPALPPHQVPQCLSWRACIKHTTAATGRPEVLARLAGKLVAGLCVVLQLLWGAAPFHQLNLGGLWPEFQSPPWHACCKHDTASTGELGAAARLAGQLAALSGKCSERGCCCSRYLQVSAAKLAESKNWRHRSSTAA